MQNNIKQILKKQGRTVQWLCDQMGYEYLSKMSNIITGKVDPRLTDAVKIAQILDTPFFEVWPIMTPQDLTLKKGK